MNRISIRWYLTLWYGVAWSVMLCGFCLLLILLMRQQTLARTDAGLYEEVKEISLEIDLADNASEFRTAAEARFTGHSFYEFLITDREEQVIFASSDLTNLEGLSAIPFDESTPVEFITYNSTGSGPYRIVRSYVSSKFGRLNVQVLSSLAPLYADLRTLQWVIAGLLPLSIALALAIGHFLAGQALSPVQRVVEVANSIDISCLNRRIEVANSHDEIGKLAAAINSLIVRLEKAVQEIRRFTADASHEIRTPLAVLRAEAETTLHSSRSPEEYVRSLTVVVEETTRLGRLADQLLHLSRHDAGITYCAHEPVQLDALLRDVTDQLKPLATVRGVILHCRIETSCEVSGDDIRLSQVFFNVIENAIKYTPQDGQVTIQLRVEKQEAIIEVEDSGIGIPTVHLPHVFERFYRVDDSRQSDGGGAGLGLSIAKTAVIAHQGRIDIRSQQGVGTTVIIHLPVYTPEKH